MNVLPRQLSNQRPPSGTLNGPPLDKYGVDWLEIYSTNSDFYQILVSKQTHFYHVYEELAFFRIKDSINELREIKNSHYFFDSV